MSLELTNRQLTDIFLSTPLAREELAKATAKRLAERKASVEAIAKINEQESVDFAKAQAAYDAADKRYHDAFEALKKADEARRIAFGDRHNVSARAELARRPQVKKLAETKDERIDLLYVAVSKAHAEQPTPRDAALIEAVRKRQAARLDAMKELDALWCEPLDGTELDDRLAKIARRAGVNLRLTPNQN